MSPLLIDFCIAIASGLLGIGAGWCLCSTTAPARTVRETTADQAREVLRRLRELSLSMKHDVGEHNSQIEAINDELSAAGDESAAVVNAVTKLLDANQQMQRQLKSAEERLEQQAVEIETHVVEARTDALTGLANRRAFDDDIGRCVRANGEEGIACCLAMLDVDHFKKFNDVHGHPAGDEVLRGVARVLRRCAREGDLVTRYGGEEFAIVFPQTKLSEATGVILSIGRAVDEETFRFEGKRLHVTISEGVAEITPGEDIASLMRRADSALYASKKAGRNCAHYHDGEETRRLLAPGEVDPDAPGDAESGGAAPSKNRPKAKGDARPGVSDEFASLPNRNAFRDDVRRRLSESQRYGTSVAITLVRVDDWNQLVETHGKPAARLALVTVTKFLAAAMRDMDFVARFDDETFGLLLPGAQSADATGVAARLHQAISRCRLSSDGNPLTFTVSIGVGATCADDDLESIIARTEAALKQAITSGGDRVCVNDGQSIQAVDLEALTSP